MHITMRMIFGSGLLLFGTTIHAADIAAASQQQWQYTSVPICRASGQPAKQFEEAFHSKLNEIGAKGFELVSMFPYKFTQMKSDVSDCMFAVFKRPIERVR